MRINNPSFDLAHAFTSLWEGGFVNHPSDPGGATNFGVSLRWLKNIDYDVNGDGVVDINDIKDLTPEIAAFLFKQEFWDSLGLDILPPLTAMAIYDSAVNTGNRQAVKFLQRASNKLPFKGKRLHDDGLMGPLTSARILEQVSLKKYHETKEHHECQDLKLGLMVVSEREYFHKGLANKSPFYNRQGKIVDYRPFLRGWLNRCRGLKDSLRGIHMMEEHPCAA